MIRSNGERKGNFSFVEQRELIKLAAEGKSVDEISKLMGRSGNAILELALRLGIRLKPS
jgi:hypothetical protein